MLHNVFMYTVIYFLLQITVHLNIFHAKSYQSLKSRYPREVNLGCNHTFPTGLAQNGIPFGGNSINKVFWLF